MEGSLATEIPNSITILFALMNPFALLGIYINLTEKYKPKEKKKILVVMVLAINTILFVFLFTGTQLLNFFGVDIAGFTMAGGIIIFLIGLGMIRAKHEEDHVRGNEDASEKDNPSSVATVPLAIPILAGPGTISTVINLSHTYNSSTGFIAIAVGIVTVSLIVFAVFLFAPVIAKKLGRTGLNVITRIMGLILMAMAFDMLAKGLMGLFPILS